MIPRRHSVLPRAETGQLQDSPPSLDKTVVWVGTIGHIDHGKSTLTSAITYVQSLEGLATPRPISTLDKLPEERDRNITVLNGYCTFDTNLYRYIHVDCPGHINYIDQMIAGSHQMDAVILVVSAVEGVMPQTREHLLHAQIAGVEHIVVFISMIDRVEDPVLLEVVKEEVRTLLDRCGYEAAQVPVLCGDSRAVLDNPDDPKSYECIRQLLQQLDDVVRPPVRDLQGPFLMPVTEGFSIPGRGTVLTGRVDRGTVHVRDRIEIVHGNLETEKSKVKAIECFREPVECANAGDLVGLLVSGGKGQGRSVVVEPGEAQLHEMFWAEIQVIDRDMRPSAHQIRNGYRPFFHFRTASVSGELLLPKRHRKARPGERFNARVKLQRPVVAFAGYSFSARNNGETVLFGRIQEFLD